MHMKYWNMKMRYLICISTTTEHMDNTLRMDNTGVHCSPPTKFCHCSPYSPLDICLFLLLANQNKYANEMFIMHIQWWQKQWVLSIHVLVKEGFLGVITVLKFLVNRNFFRNFLLQTANAHMACYATFVNQGVKFSNIIKILLIGTGLYLNMC